MTLQLSRIPDAVAETDGFPRVDWEIVDRWLTANVVRPERRPEARLEAVLQWLELLAERLGDDYWINSAPRCVLLTNQSRQEGDDLLRFAERALDQIANLLEISPDAPEAPKHILVRLHSVKLYHAYVSHFCPDAEPVGSMSMCVRPGMPHIAFRAAPSYEQTVISGELAYAVLSRLNAPLWIAAGVTLIVEQQVAGRHAIRLDRETARHLHAYWHRHGLADFWSGKSFHSDDEGRGFSYQLAEILMRLILADHRRVFLEFLKQAKREDGGEAAARQQLGKSLDDIAAQYLGEVSPP
jgi:hypothetical protein